MNCIDKAAQQAGIAHFAGDDISQDEIQNIQSEAQPWVQLKQDIKGRNDQGTNSKNDDARDHH